MKPYINDTDFLNDDQFIKWRLFQTKELEQYWNRFAEEHPESTEAMNDAIRKFKAVKLNDRQLTEETKDLLLRKIMDDAKSYKAPQHRIPYYWYAAASVALLVVSSLIFFRYNHPSTLPDQHIANALMGQVMPENEIRLISGEKTISSKSKNIQIIVGNDGKASVIEDAGTTGLALAEGVTNRLVVPLGKRSNLQLVDGTKVWLNSGTELEFPSKFNGNTREIVVKGEIYIEVAEDKGKPFYVSSDQFKVMVLGTTFNISAYPENTEKSVVLVDGSVRVNTIGLETIDLVPGEMFVTDAGQTRKTKVDVAEYINWKDGILIFNDAPFSSVLKQIGRYYNVHFEEHVSNHLSTKTCTGKLLLSDNFDEVMTSLSALTSTIYIKEDNKVYIKEK